MTTYELIETMRDYLQEAHDQHIYDRDDDHPKNCGYCAIMGKADEWLMSHPIERENQ